MKTIFKSLVLIAAAAFTLNSCVSKEATDIRNTDEPISLRFVIRNADKDSATPNADKQSVDPEMKAILDTQDGKNFLNWENGDKIGTFSEGSFTQGSNTYTESKNNAGTVEVDGSGYTLNVQAFNPGSITKIYSYYPFSSAAGKEKTSAIVHIPESQHMTSQGFDADAMPMAGEPVSVNLTMVANTDEPCGEIRFSNLGAIIRFNIYSSVATDETITSVTYKGDGIGGAFTIDLTAVDVTDTQTLVLTDSETVDEITTSVDGHPSIPTEKTSAIPVYMVVAPGTYSNTQIIVTTNAHTYTLDASSAKTYARAHVKPLNVNIQSGTQGDLAPEETWSKVTKAADFTAGTYYILRADGEFFVPNGTGNPSCEAYTSGDPITSGMRWTATANGDGLIFESVSHPGNYLWTTNTGSANTISVTQNSTGAHASNVWEFASVEANSTTYYTATAGADKYLTSYGTSNWRYYASSNINASNIPAEFYKLDDNTPSFSVESPLDVPVAEDSYSISVTRKNFTGAITVSVPANCDWIIADDVAANANSFDIMVSQNTGDARSATLTLSGSGVTSQTLVVNQASALVSYDFENVAELNALANSTATAYYGHLSNAVISYVPDEHNAVIKDATGSVLLYYKNDSHGLLQGQTFTGDLTVTVVLYNSCAELTACDASFTGATASVAPATVTLENLAGHLSTYQNAYVQVTGLEVTSVSNKNINVTDGTRTYVVYSSPANATCVAGDIISVIGTVAHYSSSDQIKVWATSNITVTGHVTPSYAITFNQPASGGSFTVSVDNANITSGTSVEQGETVTLTATPASGYSFSSWNVNGATVASASSATTTFTMGTSAVTISASFTSNSVSGPTSGDTLFSTDFGSSAVALASYTGGTSYNNASTITYAASNASYVKIDTGSAGNMTSANLFIGGKNGGAGLTATIAGIKTYGATSVTVTWAANNANSKVSIPESSTAEATSANNAANSATFTLSGTETTISLVFTGIGKNNTRVDDVSVKYN